MDFGTLLTALDWKSILEQTIAGLICIILPLIITLIIKKIWNKKKKGNIQPDAIGNTESIIKNPLLVSIFFTLFTAMITITALFFLGESLVVVGLLFVTMFLGILSALIYDNQCPNCNRVLTKQLIHKETIKEEERPYRYRDETIYQYSDGSFKERKYSGETKTIMEKWREEKEFYECQKCHYKWHKIFEKNLGIDNRPKPSIVLTKTEPPN